VVLNLGRGCPNSEPDRAEAELAAEISRNFRGPGECRLECNTAMQWKDLGVILIAGVSIRNVGTHSARESAIAPMPGDDWPNFNSCRIYPRLA